MSCQRSSVQLNHWLVMRGLVPRIHTKKKHWIAGTSPATTMKRWFDTTENRSKRRQRAQATPNGVPSALVEHRENLMSKRSRFGLFALAVLVVTLLSHSAEAADISGAWASDASVCSKVFVKDKGKISLRPDSELYGGGLIIEGNRATGGFQKCHIKSMKGDSTTVRLIAACSTGVMVSDIDVTVKIVGDDQITLSRAEPFNTTDTYVRCRL
jgi:hypothetical protein